MQKEINNFLKLSNQLADEARKISLYYFKKKIIVKNKKKRGFDPVTVADIKIQKKLNKIILNSYPNHSILGEEESFLRESNYEWCIDPIDGTKSFIQGVPLWGTLISISKNNKIVLGLVDIPALDERYIGYLNVAYKIVNNKQSKLSVSKAKNLSEAILSTTSPYTFASKGDQNQFEKLSNKTKTTRVGGDCYSYCLLADGYVDIVVESGLKPWDIRALEPILKNAGGVLKTWENKSIHQGGKIIACSDNSLYNKCRKILNEKPSY